MVDPELERRYADCKELVDAWRVFLELISVGIKDPSQINPQYEQAFLNSKARIAMLHDSFMEAIKNDKEKSTGANMLGLVNRSITLRHVAKSQDVEKKKMEIEWHEVYLMLNECIVGLEEERAKLLAINEFNWKVGKVLKSIQSAVWNFVTSPYLKFAVGVVVVVGAVASLFIFEDALRKNPQTGKYFSYFLYAQRQFVGIEAPYMSIGEFTKGGFNKPVPGVKEFSMKDSGVNKVAAALAGLRFNLGDKSPMELVGQAAQEAEVWTADMENGVRPAAVYLIYYFDVRRARALETAFKSANPGNTTNFNVVRKANIVGIAYAPRRDAADILAKWYLSSMAPNAVRPE